MVNSYYQKQKEKLRREVRERYQNLSGEEKDKKRLETDIMNVIRNFLRNKSKSNLSIW